MVTQNWTKQNKASLQWFAQQFASNCLQFLLPVFLLAPVPPLLLPPGPEGPGNSQHSQWVKSNEKQSIANSLFSQPSVNRQFCNPNTLPPPLKWTPRVGFLSSSFCVCYNQTDLLNRKFETFLIHCCNVRVREFTDFISSHSEKKKYKPLKNKVQVRGSDIRLSLMNQS